MRAAESVVRAIVGAVAGTDCTVAAVSDHLVSVTSPSARPGRRIEVHIRDRSDFDVAFYVPGASGSPFEQVVAGPLEDAREVLAEVGRVVGDLVAERVVLVIDSRRLGDRRRFLPRSELGSPEPGSRRIVVSWCGTHDANAPTH